MLEQGKPAKCWQEIASEMADEPDADTLLQFAKEMDEALLQEAREKERARLGQADVDA
jgi:vacuolar-type H+-ATPase subunit H